MEQKKYTYEDFLEIIKTLRSENGCPWDREQTHESIKKSFIEETYEVIEAINNGAIKNAEAIAKLTAAIDKMNNDNSEKIFVFKKN